MVDLNNITPIGACLKSQLIFVGSVSFRIPSSLRGSSRPLSIFFRGRGDFAHLNLADLSCNSKNVRLCSLNIQLWDTALRLPLLFATILIPDSYLLSTLPSQVRFTTWEELRFNSKWWWQMVMSNRKVITVPVFLASKDPSWFEDVWDLKPTAGIMISTELFQTPEVAWC